MITLTDPARMTAEERLDEVAAILATGVRRLLKKLETEKIPLDKSPGTRPYVQKTNRTGERA
ncbi:MAG: hypothetical protein HQL66_02055 [Magnetococcales bacterium]|nr:hypothetical protein [Magnetococcales bacterium]